MGFLKEFDSRSPTESNALLFEALCNDPLNLCAELRSERPILRFWSLHPGNPDTDTTHEPSYAYLLTSEKAVRFALERFSMKSYSRPNDRYFLAMDAEQRHELLRARFEESMAAVSPEQIDHWAHEAVEEAWDLQLDSYRDERLTLDVREFSREAALRFCGRIYGLPRDQVIFGPIRKLSASAFEMFIWKLFARHFDAKPDSPPLVIEQLAQIAAQALQAAASSGREPETFTEHLLRLNQNQSPDSLVMSNKELVSNLIGAFQGFIDNAVSCTCIALDEILQPAQAMKATDMNGRANIGKYSEFQQAFNQGDRQVAMAFMRSVQRAKPPAPWLPRVGKVSDLPGWNNSLLPPAAADGTASCILAMGSAMADSAMSPAQPIYPNVPKTSPDRYDRPEDLRLGHGFHRCVGLELGDTLVFHILTRIASLDEVRVSREFRQNWSWITSEFEIEGKASACNLSARWNLIPGSEQTVAMTTPGTVSQQSGATHPSMTAISAAQFKSISPQAISDMSAEQVASLSELQLKVLTDRQLRALSADAVSALGNKVTNLSAEQFIMLPSAALSALNIEQIDLFDNSQVSVVFRNRVDDLSLDVGKRLAQRFAQLSINEQAIAATPRPYPHSLWSASFEPVHVADYTTWNGLVDQQWTARHLRAAPASSAQGLPTLGEYESEMNPGHTTDVFQRPAGQQKSSKRTNVLFTWFAQWVSDSFLRTNPNDRRRNGSNHDIDLCQIYGLNEDTTHLLRAHRGGRLRTHDSAESDEYLPLLFGANGNVEPHFQSLPYVRNGKLRTLIQRPDFTTDQRNALFATGLDGGNSSFGYSAISTLFLREHNRICRKLTQAHPCWDDERLFQTTRLILTVLALKLIVEEYINHIAGSRAAENRLYRLDHTFAENESWYRSNRITLEFNLLYRWHSLVPDDYRIGSETISFKAARLNNIPLLTRGLKNVVESAVKQAAGRPSLYNTTSGLLAAEHAALKMSRQFRVRSYDDYRKHFGLGAIGSFDNLSEDADVMDVLEQRYGDVSNLEFLVGLYAEEPQEDRLFGNLMTRMLAYDAFTQIFTNPLLSRNVYHEDTFSETGMSIIDQTHSLSDLWSRNVSAERDGVAIRFSLPESQG